jgi:anti-sigma factor RsiW
VRFLRWRKGSGEMPCQELVEAITEYLEGTMAPEDRRRFDAHLRKCPYCSAYLEQMRQTIVTMGALTEESIAPEARDELIAAFRDWRAA